MCVYTFRAGVDKTRTLQSQIVNSKQRNKASAHEMLQRFAECILPRTKISKEVKQTLIMQCVCVHRRYLCLFFEAAVTG